MRKEPAMLAERAPTVLIVDDDNDMRLYCVKAR